MASDFFRTLFGSRPRRRALWLFRSRAARNVERCAGPIGHLVGIVEKPLGCAPGRSNGGLFPSTGRGGESTYTRSDNPYLQQRYFEYTDEIRPAKIAQNLMSIREQITQEMADDLVGFMAENAAIRQSLARPSPSHGLHAASA